MDFRCVAGLVFHEGERAAGAAAAGAAFRAGNGATRRRNKSTVQGSQCKSVHIHQRINAFAAINVLRSKRMQHIQ